MILAALEIKDYKQYVGEHRIEPPAQGVVGVIGANGVGKTTLFEAIEWCLYNPLAIANAEVPPRGGVGGTRVRVTLEDPNDGARYVIERTLRRGVAGGEVYREDQPETPIVQGSRQVTDYVARTLLGLGHRAFVSTFFTRQKELSFFGTLGATDRRREVARLLGFETIRTAQTEIGDERTRLQADARGLALQHDEATADRDLAAEEEATAAAIASHEIAAAEAAARVERAAVAHTAVRAGLDAHRDLERRDAALALDLARVAGDERAAAAARTAADDALRRLDEAAAARDALAPVADRAGALTEAVAAFESERDRAATQRQLGTDRARADRARETATRELRRVVAAAPGVTVIPDWAWAVGDTADPVAAAQRRVAAVVALDVAAGCAHAVALAQGRAALDLRDAARAKADRYAAALAALGTERGALLRAGRPEVEIATAERDRDAARQTARGAEGDIAHAAAERGRLEPIVVALKAQRFDDECPLCGRAFSNHEATDVLHTLAARVADLIAAEADLAVKRQEALAAATAADAAHRAADVRRQALAKLDGRIAEGQPKVDDAEREAAVAAEAAANALRRAALDAEPSPADVEAAQHRADLLQAVERAATLLAKFGADAAHAAADAAEADRALLDLGPVAYDPAAHAAAQDKLTAARAAAARIARIGDELAQRPAHIAGRAAAEADLARLAAERTRVETDRAALAYRPEALAAAATAEAAGLAEERAAADARNTAQTALRDALAARDTLVADRVRLADLRRRAETRAREADELDRMYREFTAFDRYVARRVTPVLTDHTGELLGAVTEGKYDRVEFDENYGPKLFDGDEKFPIEEFSGGERDVAALCARLALSRIVGAQAARPPSFLVLDEVFGSLDQDRRAHVLATLGLLADNTEAFRQLFIISHVDDIRLSPIFTELWRVAEADGVSRVDNITQIGAGEDL